MSLIHGQSVDFGGFIMCHFLEPVVGKGEGGSRVTLVSFPFLRLIASENEINLKMNAILALLKYQLS